MSIVVFLSVGPVIINNKAFSERIFTHDDGPWSLNNYRSQTSPDGLVPHRLIAVEDLVIKLI